MKQIKLGRGELALTEPHPAAHAAKEWIAKQPPESLHMWLESFSSCAIEGNRLGEICGETLNRLMTAQPVSDRYLLGLAWTMRAENWPTLPKQKVVPTCKICGETMRFTAKEKYECPCEPPTCEPQELGIVALAERVARTAHADQFRRDGVTPYVTHLEAVANKLKNESDDVQAAAWLHDILEDTGTTELELLDNGIPESVVDVVRLLTYKFNGEADAYVKYADYLLKIKENPVATKVKIADMLHNLGDSPTKAQILKYTKGLQILHDTTL